MQQAPDQVRQPNPSREFAAPTAKIDSAEHDFTILRSQRPHLRDHLFRRSAAAAPTHERNNAERTAIVAAVLNLQIRPRPFARGIIHGSRQKIPLLENISDGDLAVIIGKGATRNQIGNLRLVRISHHQRDALNCRQFLRRALRVASRHQDARVRMLPVHPPYCLPYFVIRGRGHRARVQDDQPGIGGILDPGEPARREASLDRRAIRLRCTAAEIPDPESFQALSVSDTARRGAVQ